MLRDELLPSNCIPEYRPQAVLDLLRRRGPMRLGEIAKALGWPSPKCGVVLVRLHNQKRVVRTGRSGKPGERNSERFEHQKIGGGGPRKKSSAYARGCRAKRVTGYIYSLPEGK